MNRRYAGIGSRETPEPILRLMESLSGALATGGWTCVSGGATGADSAFQRGCNGKHEIYIPWNGFSGLFHDQKNGIINADFLTNGDLARRMAFAARGTFSGLSTSGIRLHCRNAYQIMGIDLRSPVEFVVCYAEPVGKSKVKGGTNTAVQIALKNDIRVYNLYTDEGLQWAQNIVDPSKCLWQMVMLDVATG